jgi:O-antigen ligase
LKSLPKQYPTMAESMQSHLGGETRKANAPALPGWASPALLGLAAGIVAALFVIAHWTLVLVGAITVVWLSAVEYEPLLLATVFLLPLSWARPEGLIRDVMTPLRLLILSGFFAGRLWRGTVDWRRLWASPISRASVWFCAIALGSVVLGPVGWMHDSVGQTYRLASWIGFYFFVLVWINSSRRLVKVLTALMASVCLLGLFSMVQEAVGGYTSLWLYFNPPGPGLGLWAGRAPSLLYYPTALAGYLDLALPFAVACWAAGRGRLKMLGGWALGLGAIALVFTQSLGGLFAFGFILCLAIYSFVRSMRRRALLYSSLAAVVCGFYLMRHVVNPAHFGEAARSLPPDVIIRLLQYHAAIVLFLQHPILGVGWGNFGTLSGYVLPDASWMPSASVMASNLYLNLMAETGLVGLAAFLYLLFIIVRTAWREMRREGWAQGRVFAFGALAAVLAVLVHGLFDYLFFASQSGTFFWLAMGMLVVSSSVHSRGGSNGDSRVSRRNAKNNERRPYLWPDGRFEGGNACG